MVCTSMGPVAIELFRSLIFCPNSHNNGVHREVNVDKRLCTPVSLVPCTSLPIDCRPS